MADERENIRPPEKSLAAGQKPDVKAAGPAAPQKEVPIGFGVVTPEMERYRAMIAKDPSSRVFAALAELYRKAGMLDEAVRLCLNGTKAHPKYMSGRVALARAYVDKGMIKEAKEEVLTVVSITPDNILANKILGEIHLLEGDTAKAVESFTKVLALAPDDVEAKQTLLEAHKGPKKPEHLPQEAEDILEGEILEELTESEPSEIIEDATPIGQGGDAADELGTSVGQEILAAETAGQAQESGDLDIPLEDDGSLDELIADDFSEDTGAGHDVGRKSPSGQAHTEDTDRDEDASTPTVGYAPDEESEVESNEETVQGDMDIEGDQELFDEFGIMEEDEGDITVEGLDNARKPSGRTAGGVSKEGAGPRSREPGTERPMREVERAQEATGEVPDTQGVTITTETIADIYVKQGYFDRALSVYEELLGVYPTRESLKQKIAFVKNKIRETSGDHQQQAMTPVEREKKTAAPAAPEAAGDRKLQENVESLNRWLLSIRRLRRL